MGLFCKHRREDGPAITLENDEIRCSICGEKFGLGEDEIRSLIMMSTNLDPENIKVFFTCHDSYYYFYSEDETGIHEDVYSDGGVKEKKDGKLFSDFKFVLIIKRDHCTNDVVKLIVIARSDDETRDQTSSPQIIKYLRPRVLDLLLKPL